MDELSSGQPMSEHGSRPVAVTIEHRRPIIAKAILIRLFLQHLSNMRVRILNGLENLSVRILYELSWYHRYVRSAVSMVNGSGPSLNRS